MRTLIHVRALAVAAGVLATCAVQAQTAAMQPGDVRAAEERIRSDYDSAMQNCGRLSGNAEDICEAEAKGKRDVARTELEYRRSGNPEDANKVDKVRAEAAYNVAKEMCDDRAGNEKDVCLAEAKAARTRAEADAKAGSTSAEARRDAAGDKRDAEYDLAVKRCDTFSGAAKDDCVRSAKMRYGRN
jgi:hypothetical protein